MSCVWSIAWSGQDLAWYAIDDVAVNHWAAEAMVTQDVDLVVASESVDRTIKILEEAGF